ncbi:MAG: hypothetical protein IJW16_07985, partial [Clostridia bacterium]|nr:hypothetical protein [Clostridia bacterium]
DHCSRSATNLTQLWWDAEKESLIGLWCVDKGIRRTSCSDYDRHRILCSMMSQLTGHPVKRHCRDFLQMHFSCDLPVNEENCDEIWRITADALMRESCSVRDILDTDVRLLWKEHTPPPGGIIPVLDAELLFSLDCNDWDTWQDAARAVLDRFTAHGCSLAYFSVGSSCPFVKPDLYHVVQALKNKKRSVEEYALLRTQILRFLCEECQKREWALVLNGSTLPHLTYASEEVGLPVVYLMRSEEMLGAELSLVSDIVSKPIRPLLCLSDYPSDGELEAVLDRIAARYPIGMLSVTCGGDPKNRASDRARLNEVLEKWRKKYD